MRLEVSPLQLAEWLIHGVTVVIALLQVDSVNDRTHWPIPRAKTTWERIINIQEEERIFLVVAQRLTVLSLILHFGCPVQIQRLDSRATLDRAVNELGMFGNHNTVCRPTTPGRRQTVERLKLRFTKAAG